MKAGPPFMVETVSPYVARLLKCGPLRNVDNGHLLARKLMKFEHCKQSKIHPATRNGADKETE